MSDPDAIDPTLLERLRAGDDLAKAEFCQIYLPRLVNDRSWVRTRVPDDHLIEIAAHTTLLDFAEDPRNYNPQRMPIVPYLRFTAHRDLLNLLKQEQRHSGRRAPLDVVELRPVARNVPQEGPALPGDMSTEDVLRLLWEKLPDSRDRRAVTMILDGVKATTEFAALYGLTHLPPKEQQDEVKRIKDRLDKVMKRLGRQIRDSG
jgi:hypothetical protein